MKFRPSLLFGTCVSVQKRSGGVQSVSSGCASCVSGHCVKCFSGNASRFSSCHSPFAAASGGYPLHAAIFLPASPAMSKWRHRIGEIFFREACSLIRRAAGRYFCFIRFFALVFQTCLIPCFLTVAILGEQRREVFGLFEFHQTAERIFADGEFLQYFIVIDACLRGVPSFQNRVGDLLDFIGEPEAPELSRD